jgi:hypothetical protein
MKIGLKNTIPAISTLPGKGGGGTTPSGPTVDLIDNDYSFEFDGVGSYFNAGTVLNNTFASDSFSISTWIYSSGDGSFNSFFNVGTSIQFYIFNTFIRFYVAPANTSGVWPMISGAAITLNAWHHVVYTRSGNENIMYIDGAPSTTVTSTGSIPANSGELSIGSYDSGTNYFWKGNIDEVAVFSRAISEDDVKLIYDSTNDNPGKTAKLDTLSTGAPTAWYRMGD